MRGKNQVAGVLFCNKIHKTQENRIFRGFANFVPEKYPIFFFLVLSSGWLASYVGQSEVPALITSLFLVLFSVRK